MRCERCHGTGNVPTDPPSPPYPISAIWLPCPDCGGSGIAHCCEGDQAQPEPEPDCRTCKGRGQVIRPAMHFSDRIDQAVIDLALGCAVPCPDCGEGLT